MKKLISIMFAVLLMSSATLAVDHGPIGISGETRTYTPVLGGDMRSYQPTTMIGFRFYVENTGAIELRFGYESAGGVDKDSTSNTSEDQSESSFAVEVGGMIRAFETPRSYMGILARIGFTSNKDEESVYWSDPNPPYQDSDRKYLDYRTTAMSIFLGMEPTYFFNDHFSLYSTFGLRISMLPSTKYFDEPDVYTPADYNAATLSDHEDSKTLIRFDGVWIGMRYCP